MLVMSNTGPHLRMASKTGCFACVMIDMNVFDSVRENTDLEALLIDAKGFA